MAIKGKTADKWANIAAVLITEAAAGTIAYTKFAFPFSIMDKVGIVISRIEYWMGGFGTIDHATDGIILALIAANSITSISAQNDPAILDSIKFTRNDYGTAAAAEILQVPYVKDFSDLPGGGILTAPAPLTAALQSFGCTGTTTAWLKLFYTYINLSTDEYWEMVESRRIITS